MSRTYPFGEPRTKETFPFRLNPELVDNKVQITIDPAVYPPANHTFLTDTHLKDFLLARIADYHQALETAEHQIVDMQTPTPFIPEDFGFKKFEIENAGLVYRKDECIIMRQGDFWFATIPGSSLKLTLPDAETARTVLIALGVITGLETLEIPMVEDVKLSPEEIEKAIILTEQSISECEELLANPDIDNTMRLKVEKRKLDLELELTKFKNEG